MRIYSLGGATLAGFLILQGADGVNGQTPSLNQAQKLVGTWRLVSVVEPPDVGETNVGGQRPTGLLMYDALGNVSAQIMPDRRRARWTDSVPGRAARPTPDEARDAVLGYNAYWGTYVIDERIQMVTHHRTGSLNPGDVGLDAVRRYEFLGQDRVVLTTVPPPGRPVVTLTWERLN